MSEIVLLFPKLNYIQSFMKLWKKHQSSLIDFHFKKMFLSFVNSWIILSTLHSSTEWCQISLLDALSKYISSLSNDAHLLRNKLIFLLKNSNSKVVFGAFRCFCCFLIMVQDHKQIHLNSCSSGSKFYKKKNFSFLR
jgi:hypothetical protein